MCFGAVASRCKSVVSSRSLPVASCSQFPSTAASGEQMLVTLILMVAITIQHDVNVSMHDIRVYSIKRYIDVARMCLEPKCVFNALEAGPLYSGPQTAGRPPNTWIWMNTIYKRNINILLDDVTI